ncbi:MAG: homocysteine S-methyltransferase family protein, partial [Acidimicrobiales bacterium]
MDFLDTLNKRILIFDGAMGTSVQALNLSEDDFGGPDLEGCNEHLVITRPDAIKGIHRSFFDVGVDVIETDTFGGMGTVLADYGLGDRSHELSFTAARLAREVADEYSTPNRPRFVAGSMGPGTKLPSLGHISFSDLRDSFAEQALGLIEGGSDLIIIETMMDLLIVKAAMQGSRQAMQRAGRDVPLQVQVTIETTGRMLVGSEIGAALSALDPMGPDVVGLNCATGPSEMTEHLRHLSQHARVPISVIPNAGLPHIEGDQTVYDLGPAELADWHARFIEDFGVQVIGGCCGTTPEHLAAVVDRCSGLVAEPREIEHEPSVASTYTPVPLMQDTSYLIIGERTNANGSKRFREAMLEG